MNKLSTYLFHSLGVAHQRVVLGLKQCGKGWSSVIASPYMALVLGSSFSNMSKSLWLHLPLNYVRIILKLNDGIYAYEESIESNFVM